MDRKAIGRAGEEAASLYLEKKGYRILHRNLHVGHAEFDILAEQDDYLIFCEVKTRRQTPDAPSPYGSPASAVDAKKQKTLFDGARTYLQRCPTDRIPRMDVIEVYVSPAEPFRILEIRHFENALRQKSKF